ncbi:MAG: hypothetical protein QT08_C0003G0012 [archaeon GW2011_AR17]|nr:MAG: hypothetical protein QT08_C0003G0012 [archaeon GW2011_AR17]MBS3154670.1 hypothetical protein [Candidatus Woesearchaeota archaeon]HIH15005.1 hypothetical protein [Nanoarchaeota archaeon]HIH58733.1 hypothetical protein [Nanoarchaeota archaeon]HII13647.1 hypothetical protein [Nanoarchaeota archaeon]
MQEVYFEKATEIYGESICDALTICQDYSIASAFSILDRRIQSTVRGKYWKWYTTPILLAQGKTKNGNDVHVLVHPSKESGIGHLLENPDYVERACVQSRLVDGGIPLARETFHALISRDAVEDKYKNRLVSVTDKKLWESSGKRDITNAVQHPFYRGIMGKEYRAEKYAAKHKRFFGKEISLLFKENKTDFPLARLVFLYEGGIQLAGVCSMNGSARFLAIEE